MALQSSNETRRTRLVVVGGGATGYTQTVRVGPHSLLSDEPLTAGGDDEGPAPHELLLAALGSCTSMTLAMYARRKQWPLEGVEVHLELHGRPAAEGSTTAGERIERVIELRGPLSATQRERLLEIANKCPVHRTLALPPEIVTTLLDPEAV